MITIIFLAVVLAIALGVNEYRNGFYPEFWDIFLNAFLGLIIGAVLGLLIAFALPMNYEVKEYSKHIEVLKDNNSVQGSFFLGSGQINGSMKYVFYSKEGNRFKLNQVDYWRAEIEYSNLEPVVITYKKEPTKSFMNYFAIDDLSDNYYLFRIPEGSISNQYNLDAQ